MPYFLLTIFLIGLDQFVKYATIYIFMFIIV